MRGSMVTDERELESQEWQQEGEAGKNESGEICE